MISHQAIRYDEHPCLHRVMNKQFKEKTSVLIVEEDISLMVASLGNVMEEFGHYDPGRSWHAALIDGRGRKLRATAGPFGEKKVASP